MSAPFLWILFPLMLGGGAMLFPRWRAVGILGGFTCLFLSGVALLIPIDEAMRFGPFSLKIASTTFVLGRSFVLPAAAAPWLAVVFGLCAFWFFGAAIVDGVMHVVPLGLIITGLLVASIAVQPFLFAALLIEIAVLAAVPMLSPPEQRAGRGVLRFLVYQTLGMPFLLFVGWLLPGVEASPADLALTIQAMSLLAIGFAFLLAIFPLHSWMPQVLEESSPYAAGFLLWILPTLAGLFGMSFLDRYAWLRSSPQVMDGLRTLGLIMLVSAGLWSAFERHFGRIMGYLVMAETGFFLLSLSLVMQIGSDLVFLFLIPRGLTTALWALSLSILGGRDRALRFGSMQGLGRIYPFASLGLEMAVLSSAGFPLLAGFPPRLALWQALARQSPGQAIWFLVGLLGLLVGATRMLAVLVRAQPQIAWTSEESLPQRALLAFGVLSLLLLGVFPQAALPIIGRLPLLFPHLGR